MLHLCDIEADLVFFRQKKLREVTIGAICF